MAIKKTKSFSPYNYGIIYRRPGESPFIRREYVPTGGPGEEVYTVTKKDPEYFASIKNIWTFLLNDNNEISFLSCRSTILINKEKSNDYFDQQIFDINKKFFSFKFLIFKGKNEINYYQWEDENILKIFYNINLDVDSIVMINKKYVDEECKKQYFNNFIKIDFSNLYLKNTDHIEVIIYSISSNISTINSRFNNKNISKFNFIDDELNNRFLIQNDHADINNKAIIKNINNEILNFKSYDMTPSYISISKDEIGDINEINSIILYNALNNFNTFIIQNQINNENIEWDGNSVKIFHGFNSDVNFIIDRHELREMIKAIIKINDDEIQISFNENVYLPTVFSILIFKIGE